MKQYCWRHLVSFQETNLVGNVYFANHVAWQGKCREHFLHDHAPGILGLLQEDFALVTVRCACDYLAELEAFDTVEVRMNLEEVGRNRIAMRFEYWKLEEDGETLAARGEHEVACMARKDGGLVATPIPQELHRALEMYKG